MHPSRKKIEVSLKEDLNQKWIHNTYSRICSDQFGFVIHCGKKFKLEYRESHIITVNLLDAAKLISRIILNDMVLRKLD